MRKSQKHLIIVLMIFTPTQAHSFYKCIDSAGAVTYQKTPCPNITQKKMHVYTAPRPGLKGGEFYEGDSDLENPIISIKKRLPAILSSLTPVRISSREYFQSEGSWPEKLIDIGLNKIEMKSSYVDEVYLNGTGNITVRLNKGFGNKKQVILEPISVMGGTSFEWKCYTNFPRESLPSGREALCESKNIK